MTVAANPIDLTTLAAVKSWLGISATTDDQIIEDCITAFSAFVLRATSRGPMDGSIPSESPFAQVVDYDEFYDGSGTWRQPIRNWPIVSVSSVTVNGVAIPQSGSTTSYGWVIDGDKKFISVRGNAPSNVATFQNYGFQGLRGGGIPGIAPGGFTKGIQNVEIDYSAGFTDVPFDLEMTARKVCALNYKRRQWIGQSSQAMAAGAGTVSYKDWQLEPVDRDTILYYKAVAA